MSQGGMILISSNGGEGDQGQISRGEPTAELLIQRIKNPDPEGRLATSRMPRRQRMPIEILVGAPRTAIQRSEGQPLGPLGRPEDGRAIDPLIESLKDEDGSSEMLRLGPREFGRPSELQVPHRGSRRRFLAGQGCRRRLPRQDRRPRGDQPLDLGS